jgi:hypothetical protein
MLFSHGHALIIGVGADLPATISDATGLAAIVRDPSRCAYPEQQVYVLTDAHATRSAILVALDRLAQTTTPESTVLCFFSGHGYQVQSTMGSAFYLLPYGYEPQRLSETAISGADFVRRLRAIPAKKLLLLLDCCHAGGVGEVKEVELTKAPLPPEAQHLLADGSGRVVIASSRADEYAYAGRPYSAFTLAVIEALCGVGGANQDGAVRVADIALHAREYVPRRTKQKQHPVLHFEHADNFVVAYYAGGATQPKGIPFPGEPEIEPTPGAWSGPNVQQTIIQSGRDTIQAGGNVTLVDGDYISGDKVTIYNPPPTKDPHAQLATARRQLDQRDYSAAKALCEDILRDDPDFLEAKLSWAIAELGGQYADHISVAKIERVETHLLAATAEPNLSATAWAILGVIALDFYQRLSRTNPRYSFAQVRQALQSAGTKTIDQTLFAAVKATDAARQKIQNVV